MPPRYAYWTILVDGQPTAFRAAMQEDLMPTFKRLKQKHPSAEMKWFQNGKLWDSRLDAQAAMLERGERGRMGDDRQRGGGFRDRKKVEWKPKPFAAEGSEPRRAAQRDGGPEKLDWKPKGEFTPAPKRSEKPDWKPKRSFDREGGKPAWRPKPFAAEGSEPRRNAKREGGREKLDWKPKGEFTPAPKRSEKREWKPKGSGFDNERESRRSAQREGGKPDWKPKRSFDRDGGKPAWRDKPSRSRFPAPDSRESERPKWTPKGEGTSGSPLPASGSREKRKWIPKAEYKKSLGIEAKRDSKWRPGGEHQDPRQKYKDAKKAKWQKFKKNIRTKWEGKPRKKDKE